MKKLLLILTLASLSIQTTFAETFTFSTIDKSVNSDISEIVIREAYKRLGHTIVVKRMPGARALEASNSGKVDGELYRVSGMSNKFKNLVMLPTAINQLEATAFSKDSSLNIDGTASLKGMKIAIRRGIKFSEKLTQGLSPKVVNNNEQLFLMLTKERAKIAILAKTNGIKYLSKLKNSGIIPLEPSINTYPLHHYLNKKHTAIADSVEKTLSELEQEGFIQNARNQVLQGL